ncbi:unnamed protein product [Brassica napus]|uniref:(rape) hypothetical protein n=1 Tax=Brassica napus TaxID=3708 RepID=A0A817BGJ1_BRANA|nr:unnamed protein product [Brassica napus]
MKPSCLYILVYKVPNSYCIKENFLILFVITPELTDISFVAGSGSWARTIEAHLINTNITSRLQVNLS